VLVLSQMGTSAVELAHVDIEMDFNAPQALGHGGEVPQHLPRPKHPLFTTDPTLMFQEPLQS